MAGDRGYEERAETYLRLLAEAELRRGSDADGQRVYSAADLLAEAGVLTGGRAVLILLDLSTALRARGLSESRAGRFRRIRAAGALPGRALPEHGGAPAGEWRVIPGPAPVPGARVLALILTPDRALAPATLSFPPSAGVPDLQVMPWADLAATDSAGNDYQATVAAGAWAGSTWTGTILLRPAPPPDTKWIKFFIPNGFSLPIPFPAPPPPLSPPEPAGGSAPGEYLTPGERLLARYAESFLAASAHGFLDANPRGFASVQPGLYELADTLEAAGALPPLSPVPRQVAGLLALLGLPDTDLPSAFGSDAAPAPTEPRPTPAKTAPANPGPAKDLPGRWLNVVAYYGRRRRLRPVSGTAAIGVRLPDTDGARFAVAGLHSGPEGTYLLVVTWGLRPLPHRVPPGLEGDAGFSWWLRDDAGGWHLAAITEAVPVSEVTVLRLALLPPLTFATSALTAEVTGPSARMTAPLPLRWDLWAAPARSQRAAGARYRSSLMGMSEDPETYLRRFAEGQLRRLAGGEASAADCASRVDAVAAAFEGTGLLDRERAEAVAADLAVAFAARSPERDTPLHAGRRAQVSALRGETGLASMFARNPLFARNASPPGEAGPSGEAVVVPVGAVLRLREDGRDEDVYLLSYVTVAGKAWLNVAVDGSRRQTPAPAGRTNVGLAGIGGGIPVGGHGARQRMTATDNAGRPYRLGFSGGGSQALSLGQLSLQPVPPPGIAWLEVHCAGESVRIDLTATAPDAEVTVRSVAGNIGEAYLLRRAEILLTRPSRIAAAEVTGLASAVPALRAVGALPGDSPVPGQVAALAERMGAPGRAIAAPAELPERWADIAAARSAPPAAGGTGETGGVGEAGGIGGTVAAAWLSAVLPEADGLAIYLAGLATLPGNGTLIFGGLQVRTGNDQPGDSRPEDSQPGAGQPAFSPGQAALWVRDDAGGWHSVAIRGWSRHGSSYTFRAAVEPPIGPGVSSVGFYVAGATTEIRAVIPLTWWTA